MSANLDALNAAIAAANVPTVPAAVVDAAVKNVCQTETCSRGIPATRRFCNVCVKARNAAIEAPQPQPQTATNVSKGRALPATTITVDNFTMHFKAGTLDTATLNAIKDRTTTNPWYPVAEWLAVQAPGVITITRADGVTAKQAASPLARIRTAIAKGNDLRKAHMLRGQAVPANLRNFGKLAADSHATEKGVWFFVRMP